jgi:hypothetical protein
MYIMSAWALVRIVGANFAKDGVTTNPVPWVGVVLIGLAVLMVVESALAFLRPRIARMGTAGLGVA